MITCSGGGAQCRRVGLTHRCSALPKLSPSIAGGGWAPQCVTPGNPFLIHAAQLSLPFLQKHLEEQGSLQSMLLPSSASHWSTATAVSPALGCRNCCSSFSTECRGSNQAVVLAVLAAAAHRLAPVSLQRSHLHCMEAALAASRDALCA